MANPEALQRCIELVPAVILQLDPSHRIIAANEAAKTLFKRTDLAGLDWVGDCVALVDRTVEAAALREILQGHGQEKQRRVRVVDAQDRVRVLLMRTTALHDANGEPVGSLSSAEDVTDQSKDPAVLLETVAALEAYQFALDASAIVAITDRRGVIHHVNEQFCAVSGYSESELLGQDHRLLNSGYHSKAFFRQMWATIGRGNVWRADIRNRAKNGALYWVATTIVPFVDNDGRPRQYIAIRFEITERKLAETALERTVRDLAVAREQEARRAEALREARDSLKTANRQIREEQSKLIQAEKLSSIGMLASGVAHEINNPLAGVMNCVKALSDGTAKGNRKDEYFRTAQEGLERIQQIVRGLLDYARQRPLTLATVDADEVLTACERLIAPYLRKNQVELQSKLQPEKLSMRADRSRLMQAMINVLLNAIYVSPKGATVVIAAAIQPGQVGISIRDEGPGMPDEVLERACDPFFTTKPEGEGTGLGLAVTASIVHAHGGDVEFKVHGPDADGEPSGTTVTIWLPEAGEQGAIGA